MLSNPVVTNDDNCPCLHGGFEVVEMVEDDLR
jgi:hypothetical protein